MRTLTTTPHTGEADQDRHAVTLTATEDSRWGTTTMDGDLEPDPLPWVHVSGERTADPHAPGAPQGGYTYSPRGGFSDYPNRYISTRHR
ncbi:hypothetical protein [Gordonia aichiensis]|uniref:hypothetical protein n=1 Tax=Gordonia aichiensis TaxID=36820 RepID=UPI003264EEED